MTKLRRKTNKTHQKKNGRGRPTDYRPEYAEQVLRLCRLGLTDEELADFFCVATKTIYNWRDCHPEFLQASREGRIPSDANVAQVFYKRATGYTYTDRQAFKVKRAEYNADGKKVAEYDEIQIVEIEKTMPPDVTALHVWLKNRRHRDWRDRRELEVGAPGQFAALTDDELRRQIDEHQRALGLISGPGPLIEGSVVHEDGKS